MSTRRFVPAAPPPPSSRRGPRGSMARCDEDRGVRPRGRGGLRRARAARGSLAAASRRARRATSISSSSSRRCPSSGSWLRTARTIPSRSSSSRTASSRAWTAAPLPTSTSIDRFVVAHGLDLDVAAEAMALDDPELARMLVDVNVPRAELVRLVARPDAGEARPRHRPARPGRAHARAEEAPRATRARQPGARHEPQGEPGAARRRRRRGCASRLRGDGDDRRRRALRAAERDRAARRLADGAARGDDAVRRRGAPQPRARDPRPRDVRGDAVRVRHRAGLRRRRRHALVEGVPRRRLRVARRQGALHLRHGLGGAHGLRAGPLDALPRGALPRGRARGRLAGSPERLDLVRRARPLGAGRHAGDPRRERPRRLARPRGRVRERCDRLALGDPQDREAHGPVPAGDGLRHVRATPSCRGTTTRSVAGTSMPTTSTNG